MLTLLISAVLIASATPALSNPRVICSDAGAGGYQAFPDVVRLSDGDLQVVFYAGYGHIALPNKQLPRGGRIVSMRSHDNGTTWSKPEIIVDTPLDDRDPHIIQLADGTVMLSFFTRLEDGYTNSYVLRSHDSGKTWDNMPAMVAKGFACSAPVRQLRDGTMLLGVYNMRMVDGKPFRASGVVRSTDFGKTWSEPIMFPNTSGHTHDETDLIQLPSGRVLALIRPCMCFSTSDDGGLTWTDTKPVGFEGHAARFFWTSRGILIVGHRLPNTALHYSLDNGKTWKGPVQLDSCAGAYPGFCELPDGHILCVYYEEGKSSGIRQITFTIDRDGVKLDP